MTGAVVQVHGMNELRSALARLERDTPKELLKANEKIATTLFIPAAVRLAPKGPHQGGGHILPIAESIRVEVSEHGIVLLAGGPLTPHAKPEEFGGRIPRRGFRGRKLGRYAKRIARQYGAKTTTKIPARPYIYPAMQRMTPEAIAVYERMLDSLIARYGVP